MKDCSEREFAELLPSTVRLQATAVQKIRVGPDPERTWSLGVVQAPRYPVGLAWQKDSFWEIMGKWLGVGSLEVIEQPIGALVFRFITHTEEKRFIFEFTVPKLAFDLRLREFSPDMIAARFGQFWKNVVEH